MVRYLRVLGVLLMVPTLVGCSSIAYAPGEAPPLMCRGDIEVWLLAQRENSSSNEWHVAAKYEWSEWVAGQVLTTKSYGPVTSRVKNYGRNISLHMEDESGIRIGSPKVMRKVRDCYYTDSSGLLALFARHTLRDRVLSEQTDFR